MELLTTGKYTLETQHPPLTRVAAAILPFLYAKWQHRPPMPDKNAPSEISSPIPEWMWIAGNRIFGPLPQYSSVLALARLPGLLFFGLGCFAVWLLSDYLFGEVVAFWATTLSSTLPVVLAHSSLATTDAGLTAFFLLTIYSALLWIEEPTIIRSLVLGLTLGLLFLSKYSAFFFLPACVIACGIAFLVAGGGGAIRKPGRLFISVLIAALVIWTGFGFSIGSIVDASSRPHVLLSHALGRFPALYSLGNHIIEAPLPAPELFRGLVWLYDHAKAGHPAYLLGNTSLSGWWYFFPVVVLFKTPLPFLALAAVGFVLLIRRRALLPWVVFVPFACSLAILGIGIVSKINLGTRHILPVFPLMAIGAGYALANLLRSRTRMIVVSGVCLLAAEIVSSAVSSRNLVGYTNLLAGSQPEKVLVGSDLDWGQDLLRLRTRLAELHIDHFALGYSGSADVAALMLPPSSSVPTRPTPGWIVVSLTWRKLDSRPLGQSSDPYAWLNAYKPFERIGTSYLLYDIPASAVSAK